jgi:hypothetical protein
MEGIQTTLQDVQNFMLETIPSKTILIGHSLENDLRALKVFLLLSILYFELYYSASTR